MVKRCQYGLCKSDTRYPERLEGGIVFIPFPKPKRSLEKCKRWIKACGRPHDQLNVDKVNGNYNLFVCTKVCIYANILSIDQLRISSLFGYSFDRLSFIMY